MNTTRAGQQATNRMNVAIVGLLFVVGWVTGVIAAAIANPILDAPDYLTRIPANEGQIVVAAFLVCIMGIACAGIGLALYPILKRYSTGLAMGVAGLRVIEGMIEILGGLGMIGLLALGQGFVRAGAPDAAYFQTIGAIIQAGDEWLSNGASLLCWCIGAMIYYALFYQHRLVPRWLSGWGLIGITLAAMAAVPVMLHVIPGFGTIQLVANLPILLQELVFAIWLVVKGTQSPAVASAPAKAAANELLSTS